MDFINVRKNCVVCGKPIWAMGGGRPVGEMDKKEFRQSGRSLRSKYCDQYGTPRNDGGALYKGQPVCGQVCKTKLMKEDSFVDPNERNTVKYDSHSVDKKMDEIVNELAQRDGVLQGKVDPINAVPYERQATEEVSL